MTKDYPKNPGKTYPDKLIEFVLARYQERMDLAQAAKNEGEGKWHLVPSGLRPGIVEDERDFVIVYDTAGAREEQAQHIADNDPEWVLDDTSCKTSMVQLCARTMREAGGDTASKMLALEMLHWLALPYARHEDFPKGQIW